MSVQASVSHIPKRCTWVIGVDEAGRGPVAGPLSVGLVMMRKVDIENLCDQMPMVRDSKKLSPSKREQVITQARDLEISGHLFSRTVLTDAFHIDTTGISRCIKDSIQEGVEELLEFTGVNPASVFVQLDGSLEVSMNIKQQTTIKGDSKIFSIALASIYAKVTRDQVMEQYDIRYPVYGFYNHKGYGTVEHMKMIRQHGLCLIHRRSFLKKYIYK